MDNVWTNCPTLMLVGLHVSKTNDEKSHTLSYITSVDLYLTYFSVVFQNFFICYHQIKDHVIANFWVHLRNYLLLEETESLCNNLGL